ncbi:MAG: ribonuclease P protein component [Desulfobacterales bacterium]
MDTENRQRDRGFHRGRQRRGFGKPDRLLNRQDFLRLARNGQRIHTRCFIAVILVGLAGRPRLGITVTKRVGNAVTRNRIKRICREYFRHHRDRLTSAWDINLIAKPPAGDSCHNALVGDIDQLFKRIQRNEGQC